MCPGWRSRCCSSASPAAGRRSGCRRRRRPPARSRSAPEEDNDVGFDSPRATMRGFLYAARDGDWNTAASHLDLRGRDPEEGPTLARQLKTVLDRKLWVDLDALSNAPEGDPNDGETPTRDLVGTIAMPDGNRVKILVERVPGPGGTRQWKVARVTLQQLPALWDAFGDGVLAERLPRAVLRPFASWTSSSGSGSRSSCCCSSRLALAWLLTAPVLRLLRAIARRTETHVDDVFAQLIVGPVRLAVGSLARLDRHLRPPARRCPCRRSLIGTTEGAPDRRVHLAPAPADRRHDARHDGALDRRRTGRPRSRWCRSRVGRSRRSSC